MGREHSFIGVGLGWGAKDMRTANGPAHLFSSQSPHGSTKTFSQIFGRPAYTTFCHDTPLSEETQLPIPPEDAKNRLKKIVDLSRLHSLHVQREIANHRFPMSIGGDHSVAIGTWGGVKSVLENEGFGLIWIDAHMDAHTPETSPSQAIHGMPVAVLLGEGHSELISLSKLPIIKPQNLALIGIRDFEQGELHFLSDLGVRVFFMDEVKTRGFKAVFEEAKAHVTTHCQRFGLSIDVDAFDPDEAPGTGTLAPGGLHAKDVFPVLQGIAQDPRLLAVEIAEYNPNRDEKNKTLGLMWGLISTILGLGRKL